MFTYQGPSTDTANLYSQKGGNTDSVYTRNLRNGPTSSSSGFHRWAAPAGRSQPTHRFGQVNKIIPTVLTDTCTDSHRFCGATIITLYVGAAAEEFPVHLAHLAEKSAFFANVFRPGFREYEEKAVALPEDDVATVERYVQWIYSSQLISFSDVIADRYMEVAQLFVLADKTKTSELEKPLAEHVFIWSRSSSTLPDLRVVNYAFENLLDGHIFRRLLVHNYAWHWHSNFAHILDLVEEADSTFTAQLISKFRGRAEKHNLPSPFSLEPDKYWSKYQNKSVTKPSKTKNVENLMQKLKA